MDSEKNLTDIPVHSTSDVKKNTAPSLNEIKDIIFPATKEDNTISDLRKWKFIVNPFSSWGESNQVMLKDFATNEICVKELVALFKRDGVDRKSAVQLLSLAAKNRAELLSQKSDFYPVGITLCIAFFAFLAIIPPTSEFWVRPVFILASLLVTGIYGISRFKSREQVADLKIIANILDAVDKRLQ